MKVRISIPGLYTAMELDEERAYKAFRKLNEVLLSLLAKIPAEEPRAEKKTEGETGGTIVSHPESEDTESEKALEPVRTKYRGFLYIRCPECGTVRGFHMKKESDHYHCDGCGARTVFDKPLVPLQVRCECGRRFNYLTNLTAPAFDIPCLECGTPVAVQWNEKKELYETIQ